MKGVMPPLDMSLLCNRFMYTKYCINSHKIQEIDMITSIFQMKDLKLDKVKWHAKVKSGLTMAKSLDSDLVQPYSKALSSSAHFTRLPPRICVFVCVYVKRIFLF